MAGIGGCFRAHTSQCCVRRSILHHRFIVHEPYACSVPVPALVPQHASGLRCRARTHLEKMYFCRYNCIAALQVDDEAFAKCEELVERLLDLDDVDGVFSNCADLEI